MRRICFALLVAFTCSLAYAWSGFVESPSGKLWRSPLLKEMLQGEVHISVVLPRGWEGKQDAYNQDVERTLRGWFLQSAYLIRSAGRMQEFADIYPFLVRPFSLTIDTTGVAKKVPIKIFFVETKQEVEELCKKAAYSCFSPDTGALIMPLSPQDRNEPEQHMQMLSAYHKKALFHELGHALGLKDEYGVARTAPRPQYASSRTRYDSIMNEAVEIGCDDVDGLINLMDVHLSKPKGIITRQAWKSFCDEPDLYRNGEIAQLLQTSVNENLSNR